MKVSHLVKEIIQQANIRFGTTAHLNDAISVGMYCDVTEDFDDLWSVWLERPSLRSLAKGEVRNMLSIVLDEVEIKYYVSAPSLVEALACLRDMVDYEDDTWEHVG